MIVIGATLMALGLLVSFGGRLPLRIGRLPGDILIKCKHSVFNLPLATSLLCCGGKQVGGKGPARCMRNHWE